jgi:hypothetical protein
MCLYVSLQSQVTTASFNPNSHTWHLEWAGHGEQGTGDYDAVVAADAMVFNPASAGYVQGLTAASPALAQRVLVGVKQDPSFSLMVAYERGRGLERVPFDGATVEDAHAAFRWVSRNSSKPGEDRTFFCLFFLL